MLKVYKYPIPLKDYVEIELPAGAKILHINEQHNSLQDKELMLWALVDPNISLKEKRKIRIVGTGHPIQGLEKLKHINTAILFSGDYVLHFFEVGGEV